MHVYVYVDADVHRKARNQHQGSYVVILHCGFWDRASNSTLGLLFMLDRLTSMSERSASLHNQELGIQVIKDVPVEILYGYWEPDSSPHVCKALHSLCEPFPPFIPFVKWKNSYTWLIMCHKFPEGMNTTWRRFVCGTPLSVFSMPALPHALPQQTPCRQLLMPRYW